MLEPLPKLQSKDPQQLPTLELPKSKVKINISQQGDIGFEAEGLTKEETQELTYFALSINSDNVLRQRVISQMMKDNSEFLTHLLTYTIILGLLLFLSYGIGKIFQPQNKPIEANYGGDRHLIRVNY